jgi:putative aldouronate transport system permease protein
MLNEIKLMKFKRVIQTITYLPYFISWVVAVLIVQQFFSMDGIVNQIRVSMGLDKIFFMNDRQYFYPIMFLSHTWKNVGYGAIIYLAALAGIDPALYEAARIDGANRFRQMLHISIPGIITAIIILFILSLGSVLNAGWDQIYNLVAPGNMPISDILDTYTIRVGFREGQFGYATAVSVFQSTIGLILILITNGIAKKLTDNEVSLF